MWMWLERFKLDACRLHAVPAHPTNSMRSTMPALVRGIWSNELLYDWLIQFSQERQSVWPGWQLACTKQFAPPQFCIM